MHYYYFLLLYFLFCFVLTGKKPDFKFYNFFKKIDDKMRWLQCCQNKYILVGESLLQNERIKILIDCYAHLIMNDYIEYSIINIIETYIPNDFKILSLKEQKIIRQQQRKAKINRIKNRIFQWCKENRKLLISIYGVQLFMNAVFMAIGSNQINGDTKCSPGLYLFIGSIVIIGSGIYKFIAGFVSLLIMNILNK